MGTNVLEGRLAGRDVIYTEAVGMFLEKPHIWLGASQ